MIGRNAVASPVNHLIFFHHFQNVSLREIHSSKILQAESLSRSLNMNQARAWTLLL